MIVLVRTWLEFILKILSKYETRNDIDTTFRKLKKLYKSQFKIYVLYAYFMPLHKYKRFKKNNTDTRVFLFISLLFSLPRQILLLAPPYLPPLINQSLICTSAL